MVLCFLTGQKVRKVPENGALSRVGDQAVDAVRMRASVLRVLCDLECIVNVHSSISNDAFDLAMTQPLQARVQVLRALVDPRGLGAG